ncbi:hypothetical protein HK44_023650 [Pseudomonas fluorescens HK44]|uniref:Uncharacterized protein n=1 Tax=Pseudomonas fluorescens HK44 TaxID=1042209 RepID=A0A010RTU9_PSEFL|nr:hypothetical protein HK44_023650 [Pseudomonas fluorescens HK44]
MSATLIVGQSETVGKNLVPKAAQLIDPRTRANDVQFTDGGKGVNRSGFQALQKASALCGSAGILYVSIFVAGLLVGHFF